MGEDNLNSYSAVATKIESDLEQHGASFFDQIQSLPELVIEKRDDRAYAVLTFTPNKLIEADRVPSLARSIGVGLCRARGTELHFDDLVVVEDHSAPRFNDAPFDPLPPRLRK